MNDLIMPYCLDSELALLNGCFFPNGLERANKIVEPPDFYSEGGRLIFEKMVQIYKAGTYPTIFQVDQTFLNHSHYLGVRKILDGLLPFTAEDVTHHATNVKKLSIRRKSIRGAYESYVDLHDLSTPLPSDALQPAMAGGLNG